MGINVVKMVAVNYLFSLKTFVPISNNLFSLPDDLKALALLLELLPRSNFSRKRKQTAVVPKKTNTKEQFPNPNFLIIVGVSIFIIILTHTHIHSTFFPSYFLPRKVQILNIKLKKLGKKRSPPSNHILLKKWSIILLLQMTL